MKLAILTPTYRKLDNSTFDHLKNTLESVRKQTFQDYKLFLIGDDYTDNTELMNLSSIIEKDKIYVENLSRAIERVKYSGIELWRTGGINASNIGIERAIEHGFNYICHLDHDDIYLEKHLELISDCIEETGVNFITTKCSSYPDVIPENYYTKYRPVANHLFKVSTCVNYRYFNMRFRNLLEETGKGYAADADLWNRIKVYLENSNEFGIFINEITCKKIGGKIPILKPEIVK